MTTPTTQQAAAELAISSGDGDVGVVARAGAGKTTTIMRGVLARPRGVRAGLVAFNKRIAEELQQRLSASGDRNAYAKTLHAVGFRALTRAFGSLESDSFRENRLAEVVCAGEPPQVIDAVAAIARLAKEIAPDEADDVERLKVIAGDFGHGASERDAESGSMSTEDRAVSAAEVVRRSQQVTDGVISFSDMIYLPLALKLQPDQADLITIDEAQDMNLSQLRLAARMRRPGGRIVVVGDPRQAIYSWRGAAPGAIERVIAALRAQEIKLTVTFRCDRAIVEQARAIVSDLEAAPGARDGVVRDAPEGRMVVECTPGDFILSRINAPLARLCLSLLRNGTRAYIVGADLAKDLTELVRKLSRSLPSEDAHDPMLGFLVNLGRWRDREVEKARAAGRQGRVEQVGDMADTLLAIADACDTLPQLDERIAMLFDQSDKAARVALSTIHRAKGMESDRVWILADTLDKITPSTPQQQLEESNLRYVAITRARHELVWVSP